MLPLYAFVSLSPYSSSNFVVVCLTVSFGGFGPVCCDAGTACISREGKQVVWHQVRVRWCPL